MSNLLSWQIFSLILHNSRYLDNATTLVHQQLTCADHSIFIGKLFDENNQNFASSNLNLGNIVKKRKLFRKFLPSVWIDQFYWLFTATDNISLKIRFTFLLIKRELQIYFVSRKPWGSRPTSVYISIWFFLISDSLQLWRHCADLPDYLQCFANTLHCLIVLLAAVFYCCLSEMSFSSLRLVIAWDWSLSGYLMLSCKNPQVIRYTNEMLFLVLITAMFLRSRFLLLTTEQILTDLLLFVLLQIKPE